MRVTVVAGIVAAAVWIIVKMIFFSTQEVGYDVTPLVLLSMLLILGAISVGLYYTKRKETEETNALHDIKNGMTAGVPYAVIVSIFIYFYYSQIDPEYNAHQLAEAEYGLVTELDKPGKLEELRKENEEMEVMTKEEIIKRAMENHRSFYNPSSTSTLALLGLILLSTLNSIFVTIIYRKVVFKPRDNSPGVIDNK